MSNQNNANTNANEPRKPMYIQVTEYQQFENLAATALETTQKLAKRINKLFSSVFADYQGSIVYCLAGNGNVTSNQQFAVELHFKPMTAGSLASDSRIRAFRPIEETASGNTDIVAGIKNIYGTMRSSAKFQLTEDAAEILSEFMLNGTNVDPFKPASYDPFKSEYMDTTTYGMAPAMVRIINLDLTKLIKKIYGNKNKNGNKVDYGVIPYGPVNPNANMVPANFANWRVAIMQIDAEKAYDMASEMGLIPAGNGAGPIVTGTI